LPKLQTKTPMICIKCHQKQAEKHKKTCCSCNYLQKKASNPVRVAYTSLKYHAKERGKEFSLTLEQFKEFCIKSNYLNCKGIEKHSYHIDRIDETKGYEIGNVQLLTNVQNVRKYIEFVEINREGKQIFKTNVSPLSKQEHIFDAPF